MKICPVCGEEHYKDRGYLSNRQNLTCSPECRKEQRARMQRVRRQKKAYAEYLERQKKWGTKKKDIISFDEYVRRYY